ncbi:MAG: cobalamin-dependent protein, partial [Candidatus Omnitrophota bacterium]|nr:cobalamin-dependent protein [Candidatus Omnitrophota bacterium]
MGYKVVIINPKTRSVLDTNEPLNILTIVTYLRKAGIDARIIDELAGEDVAGEIQDFHPDLVGFTATTCTYPKAVELLKIIKPLGYRTVIGGVHASTLPEEALADGFDMVVVGEGERMLLEIITRGEKKGIFRASKEMILKSEEIPSPDRTLIHMDFYCRTKERSPHNFSLDFVPFGAAMACMMTSRGCPFNCIFCHNTWRGTPLRFQDAELVIEEVELLIRNYKVHHIWFLDDDFFQKKSRAMHFCELVLKKNIQLSWATSARPDSVDEEQLEIASR